MLAMVCITSFVAELDSGKPEKWRPQSAAVLGLRQHRAFSNYRAQSLRSHL